VSRRLADERGQALLMVLALCAVVLVGVAVLASFGQALGAKGRHQRAADLAAMSAARTMGSAYPRLFETPYLEDGRPNPRHLSNDAFLGMARQTAVRVARRNGVRIRPRDVTFPSASFAPTRVTVVAHGRARVRAGGRLRRLEVRGRATAALTAAGSALEEASLGCPAYGSGGGYDGPLACRMGKAMRPDVASAFDRMAAAARREVGLSLSITSAFRSDAEQAQLFAANPNPKWVAPPGTSLHRYATELDLGPAAAYMWLEANCRRFGFIKRYAWEDWHFGYGANPRDRAHPAQYERGSWEPPGGDHGRIYHRLPSFVPPRFHDPIARAALRWNVPMNLLAAQLYAESGFNPFAVSSAGAQGIAQFMPGTARSYGLSNPFDPEEAIDAQAHLMSDLLKRFDGKIALALAGYNAGPGAVEQYGGVPPYSETRAYVARIMGLLGGAGEIPIQTFEIALVE
jgi:Transglycosylase SLT domain/D-alanyl-D-alanine carboxypeptidase